MFVLNHFFGFRTGIFQAALPQGPPEEAKPPVARHAGAALVLDNKINTKSVVGNLTIAAGGERAEDKIAGSLRKSCFSAGQLFDAFAVKKLSCNLLFELFVSVLYHF